MTALADRVILAFGWRRCLLAWLAGACGALAMPPFGIWPALAVSLTVAVWLIDGSAAGQRFSRLATIGSAAIAGWFWGFGYFTAGLWWMGAAFLVDADAFAWALPFGVVGLPAVVALYTAFAFGLARLLWSTGAGRLFALGFALSVSEGLRGYLFTGFPWNTLGLSLGQNLWLMQSASLVGQSGLTTIAVVTLASPAMLGTGRTREGRYGPAAAAAAFLCLMAAFGLWRLGGSVGIVAGVKLRVVQPNLPQNAEFTAATGRAVLDRYLSLSRQPTGENPGGLEGVTALIWPESAFPFLLGREPEALRLIGESLPRGGFLITGAARLAEALPGETGRRFFNAIQVVGDDGSIRATYDKVHLVPFGEYVPAFADRALGALGIRQFVDMPGGFSPGSRHVALSVPGLPAIAPVICFEAIFPDEIVPPGPRPGLIVNVTNDGWFGDTPGPRQHFAQARLRAVETGLPLVRAANTGISAVVDPYGRVLAALPVGQDGVIDSALPAALTGTIFARFGMTLPGILAGLCLLAAIFFFFAETRLRQT